MSLMFALGSLTYGYSSSIMATTLGQPPFFTYFAWDSSSNAAQLEGAMNGLFQAGGPDTPAASAAVLFLFQHIASMLLFRLLRFYLTASFIFVLSRGMSSDPFRPYLLHLYYVALLIFVPDPTTFFGRHC